MKYKDTFTPESEASIVDTCILFCDLIITGKESALGLKYDEENMFAPMLVFIERNASADAIVRAAERLKLPVVKNIQLAKSLASHGKAGLAIPEASFRDVSLTFARLGTQKRHTNGGFRSSRRSAASIIRPLSIEMGASLFALTGEGAGRDELLAKPLNAIRKRLVRLLGLGLSPIRISCGPKLKSDEYRMLFKGLEAGRGRLELGWYPGPAGRSWPDSFTRAAVPDMMNDPENIKVAAKAASLAIIRHADEILQRRAPELLGRDEVETILDAAEEKYPVVTGEVRNLLSLGIVREILQSLVSEQVSIRHIAVILETLADWGSFGPAPSDLIIEQIRQSLKRQICLEYADDRLTLRVLTLESNLEKSFADPSQGAGNDSEAAELISSAAMGMVEKGFPPVILCSPKARSPVKEATRRKFPDLAVLSYLEIPPDVSVEPVGEIRLEMPVWLR